MVILGCAVAACAGWGDVPPKTIASISPRLSRLQHRMRGIEAALSVQGFSRAGPLKLYRVTADAPKTFDVRTGETERRVLVVIGEPEIAGTPMDVNVRITNGAGGLLTEDTALSARAAVEWVARSDEPYTASVSSASGEVRCLVASFRGASLDTSAHLNDLFQNDPVRRRPWTDVSGVIRTLGFSLDGESQWKAAPADRRVIAIDVGADQCAAVAASGDAGIDRLELRLRGGRRLLASDLEQRPHAAAWYCVERPTRIRAEIRVVAGAGIVRVGRFFATRDAVVELVGPPLRAVRTPPDLSLDAELKAKRLARAGYTAVRTVVDAYVTPGERTAYPVALRRGECVSIQSAADTSVEDIDLELIDNGVVISRDRRRNAAPSVGACAKTDTTYQLDVIPLKGEGAVRLVAGYVETGSLPLSGIPAVDYRIREAQLVFEAHALDPRDIHRLDPGDNGEAHLELELNGDRCYGLALASPSVLSGATVRDSDGGVLASWTGAAFSALITLCPSTTQSYRIDVSGEKSSPDHAPFVAVFDSGEESFTPAF